MMNFKKVKLVMAGSWILTILCLASVPSGAWAQVTSGQTDLLSAPESSAKTLRPLPPKTPLKILKRQGFWLEVDAIGVKGWVKATSVEFGSGNKALGGLDTGRTGKGNIVSTSAARGLSPKDLVGAKPDFAQADQLQKLSVTAQDGASFASKAGLVQRKISLLSPATADGAGSGSKASSKSKRGAKSAAGEDDDDE